MQDYLGKDTFKLGFGLMRLPTLPDGSIDLPQVCQMVDLFIEAGGTYFDTAYVYGDGASEIAARKALVERYPREKYTLCTKLNASWGATDEKSAKGQFYTSLERTGAGYFDYYLLHALQRSNYKKYEDYHLWDFVAEQKKKGLIRHYGFSFHGDPALLEELLTAHPDVDFIQLQINYADMDNPGVASGACHKIAMRHRVPVTVMEPVKGGGLANPAPSVRAIFEKADPHASPTSWAIRYVASMEGILTVLSGMSNRAQMEDNLSYMRHFKPLSPEEQAVIAAVQQEMRKDNSIKCTSCHYCTPGCPMDIAIPEIFAVRNDEIRKASWDGGRQAYAIATQGKGKASACIECGQCEAACPQKLEIISLLRQCTKME